MNGRRVRPFEPAMGSPGRGRGDVPGWVLALVAVSFLVLTGAVGGASPNVIGTLFRLVGQLVLVALAVLVIVGLIVVWVWILAGCWRALDDYTSTDR